MQKLKINVNKYLPYDEEDKKGHRLVNISKSKIHVPDLAIYKENIQMHYVIFYSDHTSNYFQKDRKIIISEKIIEKYIDIALDADNESNNYSFFKDF